MLHRSYEFLPTAIKPDGSSESQTIVSYVEINKTNDLSRKLKLMDFFNYLS